MKTIIHIELNDEQLNALARHNNPRAVKGRATRKDVKAFVLSQVPELFTGQYDRPTADPISPSRPSEYVEDLATLGASLRAGDGICGPASMPAAGSERPAGGIPRIIFHLNNALFALGNAARWAKAEGPGRKARRIQDAADQVAQIRHDLIPD